MKSGTIKLLVFLAVLALTVCSPLVACRPGGATSSNTTTPALPGAPGANEAKDSSSPSGTNLPPQQPSTVTGASEETIGQLLRAEDYDNAITGAKAALAASSSPSDSLREKLADAYIARAWFYKSKRLTTYTLADLFSAAQTAPGYYRAHYELGRFHNNQWQFSIGLLDLNKAIALNPDLAAAYGERAYSYYKNQKFEAALADVGEAIEMDPSDPRFYCTRSLIYVATGKPDLALEDANKAVRIAPSDAPSYYNRSMVYTATLKSDLAIIDLEKTLSLSTDDMLSARASADLKLLKK